MRASLLYRRSMFVSKFLRLAQKRNYFSLNFLFDVLGILPLKLKHLSHSFCLNFTYGNESFLFLILFSCLFELKENNNNTKSNEDEKKKSFEISLFLLLFVLKIK